MRVSKIGDTNGLFARHAVLRAELLAQYPDSVFRDDMASPTEDEVIALLKDRDGAIIGMEPITERVLSALPNLKVIGKMGDRLRHARFRCIAQTRYSLRLHAGHE